MSGTENNKGYYGVEFYARLTRKGGTDDGTVVVVNRNIMNGICPAGLSVARGEKIGVNALPQLTWCYPEFLENKCRKIDEAEARRIDPQLMAMIDKYERSPEFRAMYQNEIRKPGRSKLQPLSGGTWVGHKFYELYGA